MATTEYREALVALAQNLWWSWDSTSETLWPRMHGERWDACDHNPVAMLRSTTADEWATLDGDATFQADVLDCHQRMLAYLAGDGWCGREQPKLASSTVAYLCMEYGLHESLKLYSGGLGVLAGDHLRSASDLGVPLIGIGLFYHEGYFKQAIEDGDQQAVYPTFDPGTLPLTPCLRTDGERLILQIPIGEHDVSAQVWCLAVGRVTLYLLDTHVPDARPEHLVLTDRLYGGDHRLRIEQEALLGLGGVRLLNALQIQPDVWHLNEGHCAFSGLQRFVNMRDQGIDDATALDAIRANTVFTTHTPVPAGHDRFGWDAVNETLGRWRDASGLPHGAFMDMGRVPPIDLNDPLCMTVLAMRMAQITNGVSRLHGDITRQMWGELHPGKQPDEMPITHITNGVHSTFWMHPAARSFMSRWCPGWQDTPWEEPRWRSLHDAPDSELWALRNTLRADLVRHIARRSGKQLDPNALTIGFARRFATYKRGDLIFREPERLRALLDRGVQLVFAGKAHPADTQGQELIRKIVAWSNHELFRDRVVFLEDYNIDIGAAMTAGADVWLNNPRRPREASGTSGQKVCLNGGINLSVLDGWWPEGFDKTNGWSVGAPKDYTDDALQDRDDAEDLYRTLEQEVLPEWEARDAHNIPTQWLQRSRRSILTCAPLFSSHRMVRDYATQLYSPLL